LIVDFPCPVTAAALKLLQNKQAHEAVVAFSSDLFYLLYAPNGGLRQQQLKPPGEVPILTFEPLTTVAFRRL
jgi:hypothetical protein